MSSVTGTKPSEACGRGAPGPSAARVGTILLAAAAALTGWTALTGWAARAETSRARAAVWTSSAAGAAEADAAFHGRRAGPPDDAGDVPRAGRDEQTGAEAGLVPRAVRDEQAGGDAGEPSAWAEPLGRAHSHNDYDRRRPLFEALEAGVRSIEADVFLVDGELLVAHDREDVRADRTLRGMYLEPLRDLTSRGVLKPALGRGGLPRPLLLLVDIKADAEGAYARLHEELASMPGVFTRVVDGVVEPGPVLVVISGARPVGTIRAQRERYVALDGRPGEMRAEDPPHLVPLVSDRWWSHSTWWGEGEMPPEDLERVRSLVREAHAQGRMLRFWATPHHERMWRLLHEEGVDLIGTDNIGMLSGVLREIERAEPGRGGGRGPDPGQGGEDTAGPSAGGPDENRRPN